MAHLLITQSDNNKTYGLLRGDTVSMDTPLVSGFKVRFIKTSLVRNDLNTISSVLGIRGIDETLQISYNFTLTNSNDTVEFMYDAVNTCFQITELRRADIPTKIDVLYNTAAITNKTNIFTASQYVAPIHINTADLPNNQVPINVSLSNVFSILQSGGSWVMQKPTNLVDGLQFNIIIRQTGFANIPFSFDPAYLFIDGVTPVTSTATNVTDIISCYYDLTPGQLTGHLYCAVSQNYRAPLH